MWGIEKISFHFRTFKTCIGLIDFLFYFQNSSKKFLNSDDIVGKRLLPTTPSLLFDFDNNNEQKIVN